MTAVSDFSVGAFLERGADLLLLLLLGSMMYAGVAWWRRGGGAAPLVLSWAAAGGLLVSMARIAGGAMREGLRSMEEPHETPGGPVTYETWAFLGAGTELLGGLALLVCGLALIFVGWGERVAGKTGRQKARRRR